MTVVLTIGDRSVTSEELPHLMAGYQMLPQLCQEVLIDGAIAAVECAPEEISQACEQFYAQHQLTSEETVKDWLTRFGMTSEQLQATATRALKLEKFKEATWGNKVESYFLSRKSQLDKVIYSLIRTQDLGIAQELYFRILEDEQPFAELARTYSKGPEAQTDGLIGPVELSVPHPQLAHMLTISQPGQLLPPTRIGEWIVIVRMEKFIPAQMDEAMRRRLLGECFSTWLKEQLDQVKLWPEEATAAVAATPAPADSLSPGAAALPTGAIAALPTGALTLNAELPTENPSAPSATS